MGELAGQAAPHEPQFIGSLLRFTHVPLQSVVPDPQIGEGVGVTVKLSAALVCPRLVTLTATKPVPNPCGTVTDNCVLLAGVTVIGAAPNWTNSGARNPPPVIATTVPGRPLGGESAVRNGTTRTFSEAAV